MFDESTREYRSSGLLLKDWRRQTQKTNQGTGGIYAIVRHNVGVGSSRASSHALRTISNAACFRSCRRAGRNVLRIRSQSESHGENHGRRRANPRCGITDTVRARAAEGSAQNCVRRNDTLSQQKPTLFIIAGPLGAGKTTFYEAYLKEAFPSLVPPVRHQQQTFLNDRSSFAVEDIRVDTQLLDEAKAAGYSTKVLFISTEDANLNVGRVLVRMSRGGQAVPISRVIGKDLHAAKHKEKPGRGR